MNTPDKNQETPSKTSPAQEAQKAQETQTLKKAQKTCAPEPIPRSSAKETELLADLQRTRADFENYRKNVEKDKENLKKLSTFATVEKVLPLLDDLDRALSTYPELKPLEKNFEKTLKSLNLKKIETKPGTEFNPELHEAVMSEGEGEKELISETLRPGYFYDGEVLRPAMVKIKLENLD